jgi:transketolase N-terminal domain/subunit
MNLKYEKLEEIISRMIGRSGSGHYASSCSALEIMYPLFYEQGVKPDEFILSKGHAAPALYAILFDLGYLTEKDLEGFRKWDGLAGHPEIGTPGVLCSSGSLGMGISKALGLAYANPDKTYHVLVGDGELQEGQNWEAMQYLDVSEVKNVVIHVDGNGMQYSGKRNELYGKVLGTTIYWHETTWKQDNSYLCKPKDKDMTYPLALFDAMEKDERIVVLNADLEHDFGLTLIKQVFPERYIQCGISEAHMVSMANGLALAGRIPICHTFGAFYRRAEDQMWNNYCDGVCVGYVAGLNDHGMVNIGKSHQATGAPKFLQWQTAEVDTFFRILDKAKGGIWLEI